MTVIRPFCPVRGWGVGFIGQNTDVGYAAIPQQPCELASSGELGASEHVNRLGGDVLVESERFGSVGF